MDKKITAKEAAQAVLKKAEEMLKSSKLAKADSTIAMAEKKAVPAQAAPSKEVEASGIEQHASKDKENGNPTWGTEPGCHKLSKFMGHREERSKAKASANTAVAQPIDKAETGHEKAINTSTDPKAKSRVMMGTSKNGSQLPSKNQADISEAKDGHKQVLKELKSQPKPNLPKEGK